MRLPPSTDTTIVNASATPATTTAGRSGCERSLALVTASAARAARCGSREAGRRSNTSQHLIVVSVPRYDIPKAAPEPLRTVQLFVNTIDLTHDREWLAGWLEEQGVRPTEAALRRAREVREAIRELLIANNRQTIDGDP